MVYYKILSVHRKISTLFVYIAIEEVIAYAN